MWNRLKNLLVSKEREVKLPLKIWRGDSYYQAETQRFNNRRLVVKVKSVFHLNKVFLLVDENYDLELLGSKNVKSMLYYIDYSFESKGFLLWFKIDRKTYGKLNDLTKSN
jgi:hypothetical protein